jgi:hypothetical protein
MIAGDYIVLNEAGITNHSYPISAVYNGAHVLNNSEVTLYIKTVTFKQRHSSILNGSAVLLPDDAVVCRGRAVDTKAV